MSTIAIRPATRADAHDLARIHLAGENAALEEWGAGVRMLGDVEDLAHGWRVRDPGREVLVAVLGGELVGWVYFRIQGRRGEIEGIYVLPKRWRSGIGTALIRVAFEAFEEASVELAGLWAMEGHAGARAFYERDGWNLEPNVVRAVPLEGVALTQVRYVKRLKAHTKRPF